MIEADMRFAIADLYADYGALLDAGRYEEWLELFDDESSYVVQPRENHEANLPLATVRLESKAMIEDRIHGVSETLYHAPYYQRHLIGLPRISQMGALCRVEANYIVIRTHLDQPSDILSAGVYFDVLALTPDGVRIREKLCVFDTELIPNSLIYPI